MGEAITVVGLGYVGLTLSIFLANKNDNVVGVESSKVTREALLGGKLTFFEKGLEHSLRRNLESGKLRIVPKVSEEFDSKYFFICIGSSLQEVESLKKNLLDILGEIERTQSKKKCVFIRTSLPVGFTEELQNCLTEFSSVNLIYCPERTIEGSALHELESLPQLIGGDSKESILEAEIFFESRGVKTVRLKSSRHAEFSKLMGNAFRDLLFGISNELAYVAEELGLDFNDIREKSRANYPRLEALPIPGPSAGPCLRKDGLILLAKSGLQDSLIARAQDRNFLVYSWILANAQKVRRNQAVKEILILGVTFKGKPLTSDMRMSFAIEIRDRLSKDFPEAITKLFDTHKFSVESPIADLLGELDSAMNNSDLIILQNNDPFFSTMEFKALLSKHNSTTVLDLWNQTSQRENILTFGGGSGF